MNIMIISPGRRVEIIEYFKKELHLNNGKVYTLDMNPYTPCLYFSDESFCIKKDFDNLDNYMNSILDICRDKHINCILTLIDPELPLLSKYKTKFEAYGINVMISDSALIEATFDKLKFYTFFKDILPVVWTSDNKETVLSAISNETLYFPIID